MTSRNSQSPWSTSPRARRSPATTRASTSASPSTALRWGGRKTSGGFARDDLREIVSQFVFGALQVVLSLHPHPERRCRTEIAREAERRVRRHRGLLTGEAFDARPRHAASAGEGSAGKAERVEEFLTQDFARMDGIEPVHVSRPEMLGE